MASTRRLTLVENLELDILLDEPSKIYSPGDAVSGQVVTKYYNEERTVKGLQITFDGRCFVAFEHDKWVYHEDSLGLKTIRVKETESFKDGCRYFTLKNNLLGNETTPMKFPSGTNHYKFSFTLPPINLPASYSTEFGYAEYVLIARIIKSKPSDPLYFTKKAIQVGALVPLQTSDLRPLELKVSKRFFSILNCFEGPVHVTVIAPQAGYFPGQVVDMLVEVNNMSHKMVQDVSLELVQEDTYKAEEKIVNQRKIHSQHRFGKVVMEFDSETWRLPVHIPKNLPPTNLGGCEFIQVNYVLEIQAVISWSKKNLMVRVPITIGSVPGMGIVGELPPAYDDAANAPLPPPAYNPFYAFPPMSPPPEYRPSSQPSPFS